MRSIEPAELVDERLYGGGQAELHGHRWFYPVNVLLCDPGFSCNPDMDRGVVEVKMAEGVPSLGGILAADRFDAVPLVYLLKLFFIFLMLPEGPIVIFVCSFFVNLHFCKCPIHSIFYNRGNRYLSLFPLFVYIYIYIHI